MLTTRRGHGFRRATGYREEEWEQQGLASSGVQRGVAAAAGNSWARLRQDEEGAAGGDCSSKGGWLQREEDEEGAAGGEGVAAAVWLKHGCAPTGWGCRRQIGAATPTTEARIRCDSRKRRRCYTAPTGKKEWAAATKQRRQRGSNGSGEEWQAAANDGWQRRQVRSREEGEKQGSMVMKRRGGTAVANGGRGNRGRGQRRREPVGGDGEEVTFSGLQQQRQQGGDGREERGGTEVPAVDEGGEEDRAEGVRLLRHERRKGRGQWLRRRRPVAGAGEEEGGRCAAYLQAIKWLTRRIESDVMWSNPHRRALCGADEESLSRVTCEAMCAPSPSGPACDVMGDYAAAMRCDAMRCRFPLHQTWGMGRLSAYLVASYFVNFVVSHKSK
ncbi:hypothetical protein BHE74_00058317, partial [Ensete ventricosum]